MADYKLSQAKALRQKPTLAERRLWSCLRAKRCFGLHFRRQVPLGPYILDFYCHEHKLAIELYGDSHPFRIKYEQERDAYIKNAAVRVLHVRNDDVIHHRDSVVSVIAFHCVITHSDGRVPAA
ncbi:MAG TPA: DUF559 domain-containing protein [Fimbriimonadaceae bacterium]|jgi:very-short-patch-repair endonuclease